MIIWIASYPKSGNTWIRSLLSSYLFSKDGRFTFELLKNIERFSVKTDFLNNNTNYQNEISANWIPSQKAINNDKKIHIMKTHNAICTINGNSFTDKSNTKAAIYIVRDPRNLISSLAHHYELSIDEAFNFLTNKRKIIFPENLKNKDFNFLGDWSAHYKSWKNINFCKVKIIKYEDLLENTERSFKSILEFLSDFMKFEIEESKITNTIKSTSFKNLSLLEKKEGFDESAISSKTKKKIKFFHMGEKNNWNVLLNNNLVKKIESHFKNEMLELGYL